MNKQEIFDKVWTGFEKQNWANSVDENGGCVYRGKSGTCCAIGLLIPDELYDPVIEGSGIFSIITNYVSNSSFKLKSILKHLGLMDQLDFLDELQNEHDLGGNGEYLKNSLINFAKRHGLQIPHQ